MPEAPAAGELQRGRPAPRSGAAPSSATLQRRPPRDGADRHSRSAAPRQCVDARANDQRTRPPSRRRSRARPSTAVPVGSSGSVSRAWSARAHGSVGSPAKRARSTRPAAKKTGSARRHRDGGGKAEPRRLRGAVPASPRSASRPRPTSATWPGTSVEAAGLQDQRQTPRASARARTPRTARRPCSRVCSSRSDDRQRGARRRSLRRDEP